MQHIAIIGAGQGGLSLIGVLRENSRINIIGVCDTNPLAPGVIEANRLGIKTFYDWREMLKGCPKIDLIVNVTNDRSLDQELDNLDFDDCEVIHGKAAMLLWVLTSSQQEMAKDAQRRMLELEELYMIGLELSASHDIRTAYSLILDYATKLTDTPAGSIALLDEKSGYMIQEAAKGFSQEFFSIKRWKVQAGGLTDHILRQTYPVIINDLNLLKVPISPSLALEGIKSLIAVPLTIKKKSVGILYVDDFKIQNFSGKNASALALLAGYSALAIERMKLLAETRKMAITDGLTNLCNQQEFHRRLREEASRAQRYERPLSLVTIDVDYFKDCNDQYGHPAGDELLKAFAEVIGENSRTTDLCARTGGEEFAIIMPETEFGEAMQLAERLRNTIEQHRFNVSNKTVINITVSIGVASFPKHGISAQEIYYSVDQALYKAKESGRNCVIGFPDARPIALTTGY